jgi:DNA-binding transcriptional MerR regulator
VIIVLIGEAAKLVQVPLETLRYYDRIGLVSPCRRGGRRRYSPRDLEKLRAVAKMKALLFSLDEIRVILAVDAQVEESLAASAPDQEALKTLLGQIQNKQRQVAAMEENIRSVKAQLSRLEEKILTAFPGDCS